MNKKKKEMFEEKKVKMIKCPGCDLKLPANDRDAQVQHMSENHPDIICQRNERPLY